MDRITLRFRQPGIEYAIMEVADVNVAITDFESHANSGTPYTMAGETPKGEKIVIRLADVVAIFKP